MSLSGNYNNVNNNFGYTFDGDTSNAFQAFNPLFSSPLAAQYSLELFPLPQQVTNTPYLQNKDCNFTNIFTNFSSFYYENRTAKYKDLQNINCNFTNIFTNFSSFCNSFGDTILPNFQPTNLTFNNFVTNFGNGDSFSPSTTKTEPQNTKKKTTETKVTREKTKRKTEQKTSSGKQWEYCYLTKQSALNRASNDPNLEKLDGGSNWRISNSSFINDIPYAKKGTTRFLDKLCAEIGEEITITSALGTLTSPHAKGSGYHSHYNSNNPKLDIGGGMSISAANNLANKLRNTGYFELVAVEVDGLTAHLDVQIKESVLEEYA